MHFIGRGLSYFYGENNAASSMVLISMNSNWLRAIAD